MKRSLVKRPLRTGIRQIFAEINGVSVVRGLLAVVGLFVAFVAALLSTVAAESGQAWASIIFASSSLLLAGVVGILTVPLLARRVMAARMNEVLRYDLTRQGVVYLVLTLVIGIAALNTGNNLLFVVLSAMLGAVLVSGVASALMLRGLQVEFQVPEQVFAGAPSVAQLRVINERSFFPAMSITVVSAEAVERPARWKLEKTNFRFPPERVSKRQWFQWPDLSLKKVVPAVETRRTVLAEPVWVPYVGAKSEVREEIELRFDRRGRYSQEMLGLATRFPFAFLKKTRYLHVDSEVIVFPSVDATDDLYEVLPLLAGEAESSVRGRGFDLYRIREYLPEDDARHVDWKASAKSGSLKLREFTREDQRTLRVVFDNAAPGQISIEAYESGIALAASLAWHFSTLDADMSYAGTDFESTDLFAFLRYLALLEPGKGKWALEDLRETGAYNIVLTARKRGSLTTALWSRSYVIFLGN